MAKKLNLSGVKEFLFNHGEKVALGVCGFLALLLGGLKLLDAAGAGTAPDGKPWAQAIDDTKRKIVQQTAALQATKFDSSAIDPKFYIWDEVESKYVPSLYAQVSERDDSKRRNPVPLTILSDPKTMRMDYIRGLVFAHDYDPVERTVKGLGAAASGGAEPNKAAPGNAPAAADAIPDRMKKGRPQTFVVVHAVFPMKQQVEEFRKALKLATQKELFDDPSDLPHINGINVVRYELTKIGGTVVGKEEVIVELDPASKRLILQPALESLLREAMYDETMPPVLAPYLYEGLAMPLPQLAYGRYPKFQLPGWKLAWGDEEQPEKKGIAMERPTEKPMPKGISLGPPGGKKNKPPEGANPPQPGGNQAAKPADLQTPQIRDEQLRPAEPILSSRLFGHIKNQDPEVKKVVKIIEDDFNVFHVLGQFAPPPDEVVKQPGVMPQPKEGGRGPKGPKSGAPNALNGADYFAAWAIDPPSAAEKKTSGPAPASKGGKGQMPKDGAPQTVFAPWERDAVVRFIDADVQPGKTYAYAIQVRIANPNFQKQDKVAFDGLARDKELPLDANSWVSTPAITIPQDSFLYAMDQIEYDEWMNPNPPAKKFDPKLPKDSTTFQVHEWLGIKARQDKNQGNYVIGDWGIVERQVVRKGQHIGWKETVAVPVWEEAKDAFRVPMYVPNAKGVKPWPAIPIKLKVDEMETPILVDFTGGRKMSVKTDKLVEEETAVEALILSPDGKLRVHNSRDDAFAKQPLAEVQGRGPEFISRQDRLKKSKDRVDEVVRATAPAAGSTTMPPGKKN